VQHGGEPLMWKTGHALVKAKLKETGSPLAGEMSGHVFFKERWFGFDDGLYAGVAAARNPLAAADANAVLQGPARQQLDTRAEHRHAEGEPFALIEELQRQAHFEGAREIITIDGSARRVRRRFRPGAAVEHDAGGGAALRGRLGRCARTYPGGFPPRPQRGASRSGICPSDPSSATRDTAKDEPP
jgi:phosphomannomutase